MKALRNVTNRYKDIVMIGEIADPKIQAEYTSDNNKLHMAYSFELLRENFSNTLIQNTVLDFLKIQKVDGLAGAFLITTYQDMFQDGQTQKFMNIILPSLLCAILLSLKGTPCLYQGKNLDKLKQKLNMMK